MRSFATLAAPVLVAALLGACAGQTTSVDKAGVTEIHFGYDDAGNPKLDAFTGKEYDSVKANIDVKNGVGTIEAAKVAAFQGQIAAAQVEAAFAQFYTDATPAVKSVLEQALSAVKSILLGM